MFLTISLRVVLIQGVRFRLFYFGALFNAWLPFSFCHVRCLSSIGFGAHVISPRMVKILEVFLSATLLSPVLLLEHVRKQAS